MSNDLTSITTEIVSAYVSNNNLRSNDLPELLESVYLSLVRVTASKPEQQPTAKSEPAVAVKKSIHDDYLISLIDGKPYKALRRHLGTHGMTPEEYRTRYDLPTSYPMVCKAYATKRSELAKQIGLGNARKPLVVEPEQEVVEPIKDDVPVPVKRSATPHPKPKNAAKSKGQKATKAVRAVG